MRQCFEIAMVCVALAGCAVEGAQGELDLTSGGFLPRQGDYDGSPVEHWAPDAACGAVGAQQARLHVGPTTPEATYTLTWIGFGSSRTCSLQGRSADCGDLRDEVVYDYRQGIGGLPPMDAVVTVDYLSPFSHFTWMGASEFLVQTEFRITCEGADCPIFGLGASGCTFSGHSLYSLRE